MRDSIDRRTMLKGAAVGAAMVAPGAALAADDMPAIQRAIADRHDITVQRLRDWIKLPSIAAEDVGFPAGPEHMKQLALDAGFQHAEIIPSKGKPGVFATLDAGAKKTLALYFMYDVKQYDASEWEHPPLEGRIVDRPGFGKVMYGRGAVNQKGPQTAFLAALHAMKAAGKKPPVNLVLVAEGEEEIASPNFPEILATPRVADALKKTIGILMPTAAQGADGSVSLLLGAKGAIEFELVASAEKWGRGAKVDIHSSEKARLDSPVWRLVAALSTLVTPDGNTVTIDGFRENVKPLTARQREMLLPRKGQEAATERAIAEYKKANGIERFIDDLDTHGSMIRLMEEPTLNIQGLVAGYTGPGGKTILPNKATAKCEFRLVPDQTKDEIIAKLRAHLDKRGFNDVEVRVSGGYGPNQTDENAALVRAELATLKRHGIKGELIPRIAGSWPGVMFTAPPLSLPAVHFGVSRGAFAHAPNEFYLIESSNPKVMGIDGASLLFADLLYQIAATG